MDRPVSIMSAFPDARFLTSAHEAHQFVADTGVEVAFAGRSNAGKSSAINTILNRRNFARTSKSPGRTQLINFFSLAENQRLVDLPGYGYARVAQSVRTHWQGLLEEYFQYRRSLAGTVIVVDSRRLLGDFDRQMLDWCRSIECPVHILLTKADKLKRQAAKNALVASQKELGEVATVQLFSATKGQGLEEALQQLKAFLSAANQ
jgi:GTP-binding protein